MSAKDSKHVAIPEGFHMDPDGTLSFYFTNAMVGEDDVALMDWAAAVMDPQGERDCGLSVVVNVVELVEDLVANTYGNSLPDGSYSVTQDVKPGIESVKAQLEAALAILNRVEYDDDPSPTYSPTH